MMHRSVDKVQIAVKTGEITVKIAAICNLC